MLDSIHARHVAGLSLAILLNASPALAQNGSGTPLEVTVTPFRTEQPIAKLGSSVTIIPAEEIAKSNPHSIADVLRGVPGLDITVSGTPGAVTSVALRGAEVRHTLVLIDGIRVNDPSTTVGQFDFANIVPADIERIEVLRGPQSALYGSDAIGGVVNIITRRPPPGAPPRVNLSVEGGSYGSYAVRGAVSGSVGDVSYALSALGSHTGGFSAFGYRIRRLEAIYGPLEKDSTDKVGVNGRFRWQVNPWLAVETGFSTALVVADFDAAFGSMPDSPSRAVSRLHQVWGRAVADTFDGALRHAVKVYANRTDREYRNIFAFFGPLTWDSNSFVGERLGVEYQGDLRFGPYGILTFGTGFENEASKSTAMPVLPVPGPRTLTFDADRTTTHAFAIYQASLGDRLHVSLSGRVDHVEQVDTFGTWRATAAFLIPEFASKLRGSIGTGAKAPSLFQLYDPSFGNPNLLPEHSVGADAGFDTEWFGGRARTSATVFFNRFRDLIDFTFVGGPIGFGTYLNVARAETSGIELVGDIDVVPGYATVRGTYTYTDARDLITGTPLLRRPRDKGAVSMLFTPTPIVTIEPKLTLVGERIDVDGLTGGRVKLPSYAKFDIRADVKVNESVSLFARAENLTDARYEEVRNYGTAGRSVYVGMRGTW